MSVQFIGQLKGRSLLVMMSCVVKSKTFKAVCYAIDLEFLQNFVINVRNLVSGHSSYISKSVQEQLC